ncbi:hypothetical protein GCM10011609_10540 [Lentzea pudingi]|uniref:Lipoprotein n=1 Tax=Lentzea pudingi TaxID=1789439 RepID=A0ABQ2HER1_9PSEU|nr:DUF5640 domain-containing protein [Lentzea pudingi]GGM76563.1 hypothetical protein GCM10011609_10540 [Lentzea pudingi]
MIAKVRIHHLFLVIPVIAGMLVAGCGSTPPPQPAVTSTSDVASSTTPADPTGSAAPAEPTRSVPPAPATPFPAELVGEWSASTSKSGLLELVLTADGGFRQLSGTFDWRGKATVKGARITFTGVDGKSSTEDWSISGGTLTLAGLTYLKADAGAGGALALAGSWMGMDDIFETLTFSENGTYKRERDGGTTAIGSFKVQGDKLTLQPAGGAPTTADFSVADAILTLKTSAGTVQYVRSS